MSKVTVLYTKPFTVLDDYKKLLEISEVKKHLPSQEELLLKLNLSWSLYYPACSTEPWQLEGVLKYLKENNYNNIQAVENKTVVTNVMKGVKGNKWEFCCTSTNVLLQDLILRSGLITSQSIALMRLTIFSLKGIKSPRCSLEKMFFICRLLKHTGIPQ